MSKLIPLLLLLTTLSYSQMDTVVFDKVFIPKDQFTFTIGTNFHQKMKIESYGTQMIFPKVAIVPKFAIGYRRHLTNFFSINTGFELSFYRMRYNIEIPAENFYFDYEYHYHNARFNVTPYIAIPINFVFNLFETNNTIYHAGLGAKLNVIPPFKTSTSGYIGFTNDSDPSNDSIEYEVYRTIQEAPNNNTENLFLTLSANIGASRYFENIGVFSVDLSVNITPSYISEGVFLFNDQILPANAGFITQYNNYIGLDFTYAWVRSKKLKPTRLTIFGNNKK